MSAKRALARALGAYRALSARGQWAMGHSVGPSATLAACRTLPVLVSRLAHYNGLCRLGGQQVAAYGLAAAQEMARNAASPAMGSNYKISIVTGNFRGAGTGTAAYLQLVGSAGQSERFLFGDCAGCELTRGSKRIINVEVPSPIGQLRLVKIEKVKGSVSDTGDGWYLEQARGCAAY